MENDKETTDSRYADSKKQSQPGVCPTCGKPLVEYPVPYPTYPKYPSYPVYPHMPYPFCHWRISCSTTTTWISQHE